MWFSKQSNGFRAWLAVKTSAGVLRTGILSSSFTATVRTPSDASGSTFPVTQSGYPGLYRFDVTPTFLLDGGFGEYGVVVELNASAPTLRDVYTDVLRITREDFDSLSASLAPTIVSGVWNASSSQFQTSGTMGYLMLSASLPASVSASVSVDYAAIADSVWDEQISGHQTSGSTGWVLNRVDEKVLGISGTLGYMSGTLRDLYNMNFGRWRIVSNQMIFYAPDNTTEVARFNLFDDGGTPSMTSVFERVKV